MQTSPELFPAALGERFLGTEGFIWSPVLHNLLGYTSPASELPRTWNTLKVEKHLKSFSCGLEPGLGLLINALWLYGV